VKPADVIQGWLKYKRLESNSRDYNIEVEWKINLEKNLTEGNVEFKCKQNYYLSS
jgi:hypothetical protein